MELQHALSTPRLRASAPTRPRLSRRAGFWAVAFSFLAVTAFSTTPSALYGLYERQLHLSSLTITFVYAVYALGVVASLLFVGHLSDWYGRRAVLIPAVALAALAALVFISWKSLPALIAAHTQRRGTRRQRRRRHRVHRGSRLWQRRGAHAAGGNRRHDR